MASNHDSSNKWDRWKQLIYAAEVLDEARNENNVNLDNIILLLSSIEEVFPKTVDPVDDLEGFAVRRFCRTMKSNLISIQRASKGLPKDDGMS